MGKMNMQTGCAGEHFVAYRLSALGCLVGMTRSGSPFVDLMVGSPNGKKTVTIQVKTGNAPCTTFKKSPTKKTWAWQVGDKAKDFRDDMIFYAFVDLRPPGAEQGPEVFIVPSGVVADDYDKYLKQPMEKQTGFWFGFATEAKSEKDAIDWHVKECLQFQWREAWHLVTDRLCIPKAEMAGTGR